MRYYWEWEYICPVCGCDHKKKKMWRYCKHCGYDNRGTNHKEGGECDDCLQDYLDHPEERVYWEYKDENGDIFYEEDFDDGFSPMLKYFQD
uniref:Uncharacterized protein n=1 Tax=viral metagenome TaxID=1070528 RepID=A0A6H1ZSW2_9ZZZZ